MVWPALGMGMSAKRAEAVRRGNWRQVEVTVTIVGDKGLASPIKAQMIYGNRDDNDGNSIGSLFVITMIIVISYYYDYNQ